jgi:subfamily B ATP-binding cassette protein MsbA
VGENGVKLSGGQKQRISIARAMLKNSSIILLDEATSALDSDSEAKVKYAIDNLIKNRTTIVIAHRLSTIKKADKIIVLSEGSLIEEGKHEELLNKSDTYKKLYNQEITN